MNSMIKKIWILPVAVVLFPALALATASSTFWAPSTASCQAWRVPHVTYDTYFAKGASAPIDTGLTAGFLPFDKIQGEIGFDLLLPSTDPLYLNGKLCTPESSVFDGSPAISFGIYNVGTKRGATDYNVFYGMVQKTVPGVGGYVSLGIYHGLNKTLLTNSDGNVVQTGLLAAVASPDIQIGLKGLKKINFVADIQTGKNVLGAWGLGSYVYFADNVSLLTGPVFFLDGKAQPGASDFMWTLQLDIDFPLDGVEPGSKQR